MSNDLAAERAKTDKAIAAFVVLAERLNAVGRRAGKPMVEAAPPDRLPIPAEAETTRDVVIGVAKRARPGPQRLSGGG
jgi:hypothetical protein